MPSSTVMLQDEPNATDINVIQIVQALNSKNVRSLCGGQGLSFYATTSDGQVFLCKDGCLETDLQKCEDLESLHISHIASSSSYHVGLTHTGKMYHWRDEDENESENGNKPMDISVPKMLELSNRVVQVSCGINHVVFLTEDSCVGVWGSNSDGQLGLGQKSKPRYKEPQLIECLKGIPFIQVAAGGYHSLALSASSAVFGWGRNSSGQLGLNHKDMQRFPNQCKDVRSKMIQYVSCGENHTAMLSKDGCVFSFGLDFEDTINGTRQKGCDGEIQGLRGKEVTAIACGSQNTIAYVQPTREAYVYGNGQREINLIDLMKLTDQDTSTRMSLFAFSSFIFVHACEANDQDTGDSSTVKGKLLNLCAVQSQFPEEISKHQHEECSKSSHGIDMTRVKSFFEFLRMESCKNESVMETIIKEIKELITNLPASPPHIEALRLYMMLPFCHLMENKSMHDVMVVPFACAVKRLDKVSQKILDAWFKALPLDFFRQYLKVFKKCICKLLRMFKDTCEKKVLQTFKSSLHSCVWLMNKMYKVNETRNNKLSYKKFYVPEILSMVNIHGDFIERLKDLEKMKSETFRFCKYPFMYNSECKGLLLKYHNRMAMMKADDSTHALSADLKKQLPVNTVLNVKRDLDVIIEESRQQLILRQSLDPYVHQREFAVMFQDERAVGDGVYQEYFTLLFNELLDPKSGIFCLEEDSNMLWFNAQNEGIAHLFHFTGYMLGLAIYNSKLINLPFPLALFKKLMNESVTFKDFEEFKPECAKGFKYMLEKEKAEDLEIWFDEETGGRENVNEDGSVEEIKVTDDNKQEYVDNKVDFYLNRNRKQEFDKFYEGFCQALDIDILKEKFKFQPAELRDIVLGNEKIDFTFLKQRTNYGGEYSREHPVISLFWDLADNMVLEEQKLFARFVTGTERIPPGGLDLTIVPFEKPKEKTFDLMPVVATCHNTLYLPSISNKDRLQNRLMASMKDKNMRFSSLEEALGS